MFDGIEVDMLSLGDADCIIVTKWAPWGPERILIDGGKASDAPIVRKFLRDRGITVIWAAVCSHLHRDHAKGLIKLVEDQSVTIHTGWMHNIRNHVAADVLKRASAGNSQEAQAVREILENTDQLAAAFAKHCIVPQEPFTGAKIADFPMMTVLGPSLPFYKRTLQELTDIKIPALSPGFLAAMAATRPAVPAYSNIYGYGKLSDLMKPALPLAPLPYPSLMGLLKNSSVSESPTTQPFNNTSTIIGVLFNQAKLLFTGDAGSEALDRIPPQWANLAYMQIPHHGSDGNLSQKNIERFCPQFANISACGDSSHPSRAIVEGLIKVGSRVFSTHTGNPGHLWFRMGNVPPRPDYGPAVPLKGNSQPILPLFGWPNPLPATR